MCLGTMTFGHQCDEETSRAILGRAADAGLTFLDTADVYPLGDPDAVGASEEIVGRWLTGQRDRYIVATKCFGRMGPAPWQQGHSRKHILDAAEWSLRRLGTDYIDLYQLHGPDPATPLDETLDAMDTLVRSGKVRYIGVSNWMAWQLALALGKSEARSLTRFVSVQPRYNLLFREFERELFPLCEAEDVAVVPYNPLAGGMLSGKHDSSVAPAEGTRFTLGNAAERYQERYWHDRAFETVDALREIAEEAGLALPTLAIAWVLANPAVTAPIVGASHPDQLDATLAAAEVSLEPSLLERLDELTVTFRFGDAQR
jgi:aryl-alcohol dehydrogenase (NADP+)